MSTASTASTAITAPHILVMDWGIGGLATFAALAERLPDVPVHYLSDSGFTPWGKVEPEALAKRISTLAGPRLGPHDLLVLACNAASTVIDRLRLPPGVAVSGVIEPGVTLLERAVRQGLRRLAVLGGARTIASGAHRLGLQPRLAALAPRPPVSILELVAQPLSAHVEAGRLDGPALMDDLAPLLAALRDHGAEAVLLACTHYPALLPVLAREAPGLVWLDPVADPLDGLVGSLAPGSALTRFQTAASASRSVSTTGDPESTRVAASAAFGLHIPEILRAI